jgi:PKD repeat protein
LNRFRVYGLTCVLMMVAAATVSATTIVVPSDEQLIAKSPIILTGTVESTSALPSGNDIWTETSIAVAEVLKGSAPAHIVVRELGGEFEDRFTVIYGTPQFAAGERVLLFLEPNPRGGYRTVDMFVGKLSEARRLDGKRLWTRDDASARVTLLDADYQPIEAKNVQRDGAAFETFVRERIAGREGAKNYGVQNPVLDRSARRQTLEQFTLLSAGRIYRWFRFDNNMAAQWYSIGAQTGYTGGGVSETRSGMDSWNNYSAAKIMYSYAGTRSTASGGVNSPNGFNEVFFNDPLNEISGTYNRSTGGVVGLGGFNGVRSGGNWNAPFTADSSHVAGTQHALEITEANLTIQDGVTPSAGISSNRLAEIIAHEFGHTLGFGHSSESSALMYASVTGLGPALRSDDQLAARWLYPSGSGGGNPDPTPTVPSAPSGLTANVSGANVSLSWTDNSNNETGFSIHAAAGTGAFAYVGDVGANARSVTLTGFSTGTYRMYVAAYNSAGSSANSNVVQVTISGTPSGLTASFTFTPTSGIAGNTTFNFTDQSSGGVTSRQWSFGDGTTSGATNPSKVYTNAGTYTVTLTVYSSTASAQTQRVITVSQPLTANYTYSPSAPTTNDTISFTDQSIGGVTSWSWAFGDGTTSSAKNPAKRYNTPGRYTVALTVHRNSDVHATQKSIVVASPAPVVPPIAGAFDVSAATVAAGTNITFNDRSTGTPTAWSWSFGDGTYSSLQNPVKSYTIPGTYNVTLIASNISTSGTATKTITVTAIEPYRSLISAAAHTNGLAGTAWRTELILFNAGTQGANVTLLFIPGAGGSMITRSLFLSPKQSATYANTLVDLFGVTNGAGAVAIEATSAAAPAQLRIMSRTFTGASAGTYGLSVPDVQSPELAQTLYLTGIQSNDSFRTNVGLVNRAGVDVPATLTLFDRNGSTVSTANVTVPANNFQQLPLGMFFPEVEGRDFEVLSMRVTAASANAVTAYASVVDNRTQDPVYMQAMPGASGTVVTLPIVGRANGANGTFWRSDVTIFNPTSSRVIYTLRHGGASKTLALDGRSTFVLSDVVTQMGFEGGIGTLSVTGNSAAVVTSRNYTTGGGGSFGQSIDPVRAFHSELFVAGLRTGGSYRSNLGFVNGGTEKESFTVTLYSEWGTQISSIELALDPNEVWQQSVGSLFEGVSIGGSFTVHVRGDANAKLFAYGSMIDNASGDPVFFAGR